MPCDYDNYREKFNLVRVSLKLRLQNWWSDFHECSWFFLGVIDILFSFKVRSVIQKPTLLGMSNKNSFQVQELLIEPYEEQWLYAMEWS